MAAKSSYMFGGRVHVPIVVRAIIGRSWGQGAQHSQSLEAWFAHIPGLKVVTPSTPTDAKGLLKTAIRSEDPVPLTELDGALPSDYAQAEAYVNGLKARGAVTPSPSC